MKGPYRAESKHGQHRSSKKSLDQECRLQKYIKSHGAPAYKAEPILCFKLSVKLTHQTKSCLIQSNAWHLSWISSPPQLKICIFLNAMDENTFEMNFTWQHLQEKLSAMHKLTAEGSKKAKIHWKY